MTKRPAPNCPRAAVNGLDVAKFSNICKTREMLRTLVVGQLGAGLLVPVKPSITRDTLDQKPRSELPSTL